MFVLVVIASFHVPVFIPIAARVRKSAIILFIVIRIRVRIRCSVKQVTDAACCFIFLPVL